MTKNSFLQPKWKNTGLFKDRYNVIADHFKAKNVLDIGCAVGYQSPNWMHAMIKEDAKAVLGLDIDDNSIKNIKSKGYHVEVADAQNFTLSQTFDVIHAGELIEHLDNFHGFLQSVKRHMTPDSTFIMTTPNAMRMSNFIYSALGGLRVNAEHTCWFCADTITTLLDRNGFEVFNIDYIRHKPKTPVRKLASWASRLILPDRVAWNTLLVIARIKQRNEHTS